MPTLPQVITHEIRTTRSQFQYQFTPKHHGNDKKAAQWLPSLTLGEEFSVFNMADENELRDAAGNLYGIEKVYPDGLRTIGTRGEQIAKFPAAVDTQPWHGYPTWVLWDGYRAGDDMKPPRELLDAILEKGFITKRGRKRLGKGDPV